MSSIGSIVASSSNTQQDASILIDSQNQLILANKASIAALADLLLKFGFYNFEPPKDLEGSNRFIFSLPGIEKNLLNPAFGKTRLYQQHKQQVFKKELPEKFKFNIVATGPFKEVDPKTTVEVDIDALLAYCFHRNVTTHLLSDDSLRILCDREKIPQVDILEFFNVPKKNPDETLELTFSRIHSIFEEKFFEFRKPASEDPNYIYVYTKSGLFIQILHYCEKNGISTEGLMRGDNIVLFDKKFYSRLPIEFFAENFLIPFCMDAGVSWEINNDDFI